MAKAKRNNQTRAKTRRYWSAVRQHVRTSLRRGQDPRPTTPRHQTRASYGREVI